MKKQFELANDAINFDFGFVNLKGDNEETVKNFVNFVILSNQYDKIVKGLPVDDFAAAHPESDFWTAEETLFEGVVAAELIPSVMTERENALTVKSAIEKLPVKQADYNALGNTDKCFILCEAHKTVSSIVLPKEEIEKIDLKSFGDMVDRCYKTASVNKDAKDKIRSIVYNVMGREDGDLFYGLAPTKSEIGKADIMHFVASFGGNAKRKITKSKDVTSVSTYDYFVRSGWKSTSAAVTTLICVIMESRRNSFCKVIH